MSAPDGADVAAGWRPDRSRNNNAPPAKRTSTPRTAATHAHAPAPPFCSSSSGYVGYGGPGGPPAIAGSVPGRLEPSTGCDGTVAAPAPLAAAPARPAAPAAATPARSG